MHGPVCVGYVSSKEFYTGSLNDVFSLLSSARPLPVPPTVLSSCKRTQNEEASHYVKGMLPLGGGGGEGESICFIFH